jgi:lipoprotein-anchoring transpeptidase ErfK/SrfK
LSFKRRYIYPPMVWLGRRKTYQVVLVLAAAFMFMLLAAVSPFLLAADASAFGRFPARVKVGGVPVGGLTPAEAVAKCKKEFAGLEAQPLTITSDGDSWSNTATEVGLQIDYEAMVDRAYKSAWDTSLPERMIRRFLRKPRSMEMPLVIEYDDAAVRRFVSGAMPFINCKPRNAYLDVSSGEAMVRGPKDGRKGDADQIVAAVENGLDEGKRTIEIPIARRTPPEVKEVTVGKLLLVNQEAHTLSLYDRDKLLAKYPVAVGSAKYPTVIGQWKIVKMEKNPTWYNRGSTWMENMPDTIPPGPNNPLGTRAMTINGGGVLIHGTTDTGSIGYSVSHGCIRMRMADVEALYEQCFVGMPVYIIKRSGEPYFDCSKPPFWWDEE